MRVGEAIRDEWEEESPEPEKETITKEEAEAIAGEIKDLQKFRDLAESITHNAKGKALIKALKTGFQKAVELGANKKAIIFTESRRTDGSKTWKRSATKCV